MKWILIMAIVGAKGNAVTSQEFDNKPACEAAGQMFKSFESMITTYKWACVPKE